MPPAILEGPASEVGEIAAPRKRMAARLGTTVMATNRLRLTAQHTVMAMSASSWPSSSWTKVTGRNTATVVSVLASAAPQTSRAPL